MSKRDKEIINLISNKIMEEWKIGEIRQVNGEWYQCILAIGGCRECSFRTQNCCTRLPECMSTERSDGNSVIFKKLEKVGEPYVKRVSDGTFSTFQKYRVYNSVISKEPYIYCNFIDGTIEIEIKQNKEDMEEKKLNLKPFDIQKAREGKPVYTRDGRKARIICFDVNNDKPIVAVICCKDGKETYPYTFYPNGLNMDNNVLSNTDLMMLPEKKEGWILLRKDGYIIDNEEAAKKICTDKQFVAKVEWEE